MHEGSAGSDIPMRKWRISVPMQSPSGLRTKHPTQWTYPIAAYVWRCSSRTLLSGLSREHLGILSPLLTDFGMRWTMSMMTLFQRSIFENGSTTHARQSSQSRCRSRLRCELKSCWPRVCFCWAEVERTVILSGIWDTILGCFSRPIKDCEARFSVPPRQRLCTRSPRHQARFLHRAQWRVLSRYPHVLLRKVTEIAGAATFPCAYSNERER
mmetsp:Transcript_8095/g.19240  ORF Transcript_8095/g.19240 Transcript_8095/m.19240 type:complete len:212 (+) Transcript_8095:1072-1707(+)